MKELLLKTRKHVEEEMSLYPGSNLTFFKISNNAGQKLAKTYKGDKDIVLLGTMLMDIKIDQAFKENRLSDHIKMAVDDVKNFFQLQKVNQEITQKVIHCIEAHHGTIPYQSKEAEIVANADCYRFLTVEGLMSLIESLKQKGVPHNMFKKIIKEKVQEKWSIVSLPEVKKELEINYLLFQELINL